MQTTEVAAAGDAVVLRRQSRGVVTGFYPFGDGHLACVEWDSGSVTYPPLADLVLAPKRARKVFIGWTVMRGGEPVGQAEGRLSRLSPRVFPVYESIGKARTKATRAGLGYDAVVEAFVEMPSD